MKHKAPLALIELLIMLLVFALAAALCLQAFSAAEQISAENRMRDSAVSQAQNAAELLKYYDGDLSAAAEHMGGSSDDSRWIISYDANWNIVTENGVYQLSATLSGSASPLLDKAEILVRDRENRVLFSLTAAWQEVTE